MSLLSKSVVLMLALASVATAGTPAIPRDIKTPAGAKLVLKLHAKGVQIYSCKADAGTVPVWVLKEPRAELSDAKGRVVIHHGAGPSWQHQDGSEITGKATAHVDSPDVGSIPWLLVTVIGHTGTGKLEKVNVVQRLNTQGGKAPQDGCESSKVGAEVQVPYSADYWFYEST